MPRRWARSSKSIKAFASASKAFASASDVQKKETLQKRVSLCVRARLLLLEQQRRQLQEASPPGQELMRRVGRHIHRIFDACGIERRMVGIDVVGILPRPATAEYQFDVLLEPWGAGDVVRGGELRKTNLDPILTPFPPSLYAALSRSNFAPSANTRDREMPRVFAYWVTFFANPFSNETFQR